MSLSYRSLDVPGEVEHLLELFAATYGDSRVFERRLRWQYSEHPRVDSLGVFVAEEDGRIVGSTTRLPIHLQLGDRTIQAHFSVDSMVHPNYRRRGIMRELIVRNREFTPIIFSKGTNEGQHRLYQKLGYRTVVPETFLVSYPAPLKLLLGKAGWGGRGAHFAEAGRTQDPDYEPIDRFGEEFDEFWQRVAPRFPGLVVKDSPYMNWRYFAIPQREYRAFYRRRGGSIVSLVVLALRGASGSIVDLLFDPELPDEPDRTVRFARSYLRRCGAVRVLCFATLSQLRAALRRRHFFDRGETPHFSVWAPGELADRLADGSTLHFVHGDGDTEFL